MRVRPVDLKPGDVVADGRIVSTSGPTIDDRAGHLFLVVFEDGTRWGWPQANAARFATVEVGGGRWMSSDPALGTFLDEVAR